MNILIIHNNYSTQGGEESIVKMQKELFGSYGHNIHSYTRSHSEIKSWKLGKIRSLFTSLRNRGAIKDIEKIVKEKNIEVAFIHNVYPIISPAIIPTLKKLGVKSLFFAHNYRLICPTGLFFRDGAVCEKCGTGARELNCTLHKCEGSLLGSIAYTLRSINSRLKGYFKDIDTILALTDFQKEKLIHYGIASDKIEVVPNFCTWTPTTTEHKSRNHSILFVGRLSKEKGYDVLFDAAKLLPNIQFIVVGASSEKTVITPTQKNITLVGHKDYKELRELYDTSSILAITSRCYEAFPLTILEAGSTLLPIIAANHGAMTSIIENGKNGILFEPYNPTDLAQKIEMLLRDKKLRETLATNNQKEFLSKYSSEHYYQSIINSIASLDK